MPKKHESIRTVSYVTLDSEGKIKVCTEDLTPEQREYVGASLSMAFIRGFYKGKGMVEFSDNLPSPETVFPQLNPHPD